MFDAAGLSLFCVTGTAVAFAHGLGPFQSAILGAITAVGGGTIRDVVIRRVPTVLTSGLYAVPALVGAAITAVALDVTSTAPRSRSRQPSSASRSVSPGFATT